MVSYLPLVHRVSKKVMSPVSSLNNSVKNEPILVIFGTQNSDET